MAAALAAAAAQRGTAPPHPVPGAGAEPGFDAALSAARFGNPLSLMMAGVLALDDGPGAVLALRRLDAARRLARRELHRLKELGGPGEAPAVTHLAAFNGLAGGLPVAGLTATLTAELATAGLAGDAGRLASLLQQDLPAEERAGEAGGAAAHLGTVQPDLIGEGLILEALSGEPAVEAGATGLVQRAYALTGARAAGALMRLLQDYAYALEDATASDAERADAGRLMAWLRALAERLDDPAALAPLVEALPEHTTILREDALALTERMAAAARAALAAAPDDPDATAAAALWLNNLSNRLSDLGRREDALAAIEGAVEAYRILAAARPDAVRPNLAVALTNLSNCLSALGRREEALAAIQEAVAIRRDLAAARPDAFRPDLSVSLGAQADIRRARNEPDEALAAHAEAIALLRPLFLKLPGAVAQWMVMHLQRYFELTEELGAAPDETLLAPILETLQKLQKGGGGGEHPKR